MKVLIIINDPPYGSERAYNALRLALGLKKRDAGDEVTVFLMADAVTAASGPILTFASLAATSSANVRIKRTTSNYLILVSRIRHSQQFEAGIVRMSDSKGH